MVHNQDSIWDKVKDFAGGTPGAAAVMGFYAALNRALSVKALHKRMDAIEEIAKADRGENKTFRESAIKDLGEIKGMVTVLAGKDKP